jgi:ABC-type Fe3+/spermidine/putrescine transport system ATPase subunit
MALSKTEIAARTTKRLNGWRWAAFVRRRVRSFGRRTQRVALASALAPRPRLLMLDEPLAALDRALREQLGEFLREVLHQSGIPAIYVTHDQGEAFTIADRLVLLHKGLIEHNDAPGAVYRHPASAWVADFLGLSNLLAGTDPTQEPFRVHTALGDFAPANRPDFAVQNGQAVTVLLYPAGWRLSAQAAPVNGLSGVVSDCVFRGET